MIINSGNGIVVCGGGDCVIGGSKYNNTVVIGGSKYGNNTVVIDGRSIDKQGVNEFKPKGTLKDVNEKQCFQANKVKKFRLYSTSVDINLVPSKGSEIEAHFYGNVVSHDEIRMDATLFEGELKISVGYCQSYSGNLHLDVKLPIKLLDEVWIETQSGKVAINKLWATFLQVKSKSGAVNAEVCSENTKITSVSGNVRASIIPASDCQIAVSTMSGNIDLQLHEVGKLYSKAGSMSGNVRNNYVPNGKFSANVHVTSMSGNILLR